MVNCCKGNEVREGIRWCNGCRTVTLGRRQLNELAWTIAKKEGLPFPNALSRAFQESIWACVRAGLDYGRLLSINLEDN